MFYILNMKSATWYNGSMHLYQYDWVCYNVFDGVLPTQHIILYLYMWRNKNNDIFWGLLCCMSIWIMNYKYIMQVVLAK